MVQSSFNSRPFDADFEVSYRIIGLRASPRRTNRRMMSSLACLNFGTIKALGEETLSYIKEVYKEGFATLFDGQLSTLP
jgi:hypothetical protein